MKVIAAFILGALLTVSTPATAGENIGIPPHPETHPVGEGWSECFWNGVRWNAPCIGDSEHSSIAHVDSVMTESFAMYPRRDGTVRIEPVSHRLAHTLLGFPNANKMEAN